MPRMGAGPPADHSTRHQDAGEDEVNIASLSGTPAALTTHAVLTEVHGSSGDVIGATTFVAHAIDADAHHSRAIADGRSRYNTTNLLVIPGTVSQMDSTTEILANTIQYYPIRVRTPITIDQVVFEVTTPAAAGEKARIAIYAADTDWQPGALQVASAEIACDAGAVVTTDIAETTLQEGRYLIAIICEGNTSFRTTRYVSFLGEYKATLGANPLPAAPRVSQAYGALPDPGTAWDTISWLSEPTKYPVFLNVKTP